METVISVVVLLLTITGAVLLLVSFTRQEWRAADRRPDELRGLSFRERRRIFRLARSGVTIDDPRDARLARSLIAAQLARRLYGDPALWAGMALFLTVQLIRGGAALAEGDPLEASLRALVVPAILAVAILPVLWLHRSLTRTARANDWLDNQQVQLGDEQ